MIKLYDSNITDILPEYLSGRAEVIALGYAISKATQRLIGYCHDTSVYAVIDSAPENVLDMLALELDTQYYDDTLSIDAKRTLIKNTLVWYMSSGTPAAVEELVAAVFGEGKVEEWYEYGDDPYYFKITTNAEMTPEMNEKFSRIIKKVKNARSHIRAIDIHRTVDQIIVPSVLPLPNYKPSAVIGGYNIGREADQNLCGIVSEHGVSRPAPILDGYSADGEVVEARLHSGTAVATTAKQAAIMEGLKYNANVEHISYIGTAENAAQTKPGAIIEGLNYDAAPVEQQAITAGVAADNSIYKTTITE